MMTMQLQSVDQTRATINDVARLAGVSIKTVSRVANQHQHVSDSTRLRVQQAIDKLRYEANPYARYLGTLRARKPVEQAPAVIG